MEKDKFIYTLCKACGNQNQKFLICADGYHAICMNSHCDHRIEIPQIKCENRRKTKNGKVK